MICAMVSLGDLQCTERESNDGDQLQGGPFPTRYHSHGCTLVCGVSLKLSACRRTAGGARGTDRPRHYPALGRELQSPVGRGVPPTQAPGVGQLAHGTPVQVVEELWARRRVPQSETVAYPVRGVCQTAGHGSATLAVPRELLDLSAPQSDQSGADGAAARAPHGQHVWSAASAGDGHHNCDALSRSWVSDASAEKAS